MRVTRQKITKYGLILLGTIVCMNLGWIWGYYQVHATELSPIFQYVLYPFPLGMLVKNATVYTALGQIGASCFGVLLWVISVIACVVTTVLLIFFGGGLAQLFI